MLNSSDADTIVDEFRTSTHSLTCSKNLAVWSVNNFSTVIKKYDRIYSVKFNLCENDLIWKLAIKSKWENDKNEKQFFYGIYLQSANVDENTKIRVQITLGILNGEGKMLNISSKVYNFVLNDDCDDDTSYRNLVPITEFLNNKEKMWPNDILTITCNVNTIADEIIYTDLEFNTQLGSLLTNERFTDLTLDNDSQKIQVHRNILWTRSEYFRNILIKSDNINCIQIEMDEHILPIILKYFYTGHLHAADIKKYPKKLFIAANEFKLDKIKIFCANELSASLTIESAVEILIFADEYSITSLKTDVIKFIKIHLRTIELTDDWESLPEMYPSVAIKMLSDILRNCKCK